MLHFTGVLEAAVDDSSQQLRLQQEVLETTRVDADVVAFLCVLVLVWRQEGIR